MFHLRDRKRPESHDGGKVFHDAADDVSLLAKFASDVGDAEDEDEEHQPRDSVRVRLGARGGEKTDEGPEKAGDDRAVEHGDVFIGADSFLALDDGSVR